MARRESNRDSRQSNAAHETDQVTVQPAAASDAVTGIVGDASATSSRSGDDARRRGWFWHWNHVVTQYSPLIGLKGVGLLNSYTVWTDRREESPHRGYAFPSQQSEGDFYGEDRAELITINKILVTLDLIEIRKEMVFRVDDRGRRWKVPHNFYRVKDQGDGVSLTTDAVRRVVDLADSDRTVYRYLRRLFSPRFSPIDGDNVWHQILEELRPTETWQRLAARTAKDETRASARSKAGHAARRGNGTSGNFSLPNDSDNATPEATVEDSINDTGTVTIDTPAVADQTSVAPTNNGSATSVEQSNNGFADSGATSVGPDNTAGATFVAPTNSTYYQVKTTTTTTGSTGETDQLASTETADPDPDQRPTTVPDGSSIPAPDSRRDEDLAIRGFEEANERSTTIAERRLLRNLAAQFDDAAATSSMTGWRWVADAIDEAVSAGSRFVAPKRIREILGRWQIEGRGGAFAGSEPKRDTEAPVIQIPVTEKRRPAGPRDRAAIPAANPTGQPPAPFAIEECGRTNRQVWNAALTELRESPVFGRAGAETWLRDTHLIGRTVQGGLVVGVSNALALRRLEGHYLNTIRDVLERITGVLQPIEIADYRTWAAPLTDEDIAL